METFVLVPASLYNNNKSLNTQAVTKQELPQYQAEQNPTYRIDSLKKEINKKLSAKVDSLVDKILFCPRIKLSKSQTFFLDGVETGNLLSDFAQKLRRENADISDVYFTLLDAPGLSPTLVLNQNLKAKERGRMVSLSKYEHQKLQRLYMHCSDAYGFVRNLVKTSILRKSKVRQFLNSKHLWTKFTLALRKIKRMKALVRFKIEFWWLDLAYVVYLAKDDIGIKNLLVRQTCLIEP